MEKIKEGEIVKGTVCGIEPYGIFVKINNNLTGLIHISEISSKFVSNINDYVSLGEIIYCKILEFDELTKHLNLSIKNINYNGKSYKKLEKIKETRHGFSTLKYKLPKWIEETLTNLQKN